MDLEQGHINEYYEECSLIISSTKKDECHIAGAGPKMGLKKKKQKTSMSLMKESLI